MARCPVNRLCCDLGNGVLHAIEVVVAADASNEPTKAAVRLARLLDAALS